MNKTMTGNMFLLEKINLFWKIVTILSMLLMVGFSNSHAQVILASSTPTTITISWTAPGDDGYTGTATSYDIRYFTSTLNDATWGSASQAFGEPSPQIAGSTESFTITGLSPNTTYEIAIKTADEVPNWSVLSNVLQATTPDNGSGGNIDTPENGEVTIDSSNGTATLNCFTVSSANTPVYQFALDTSSFFPTASFQNGTISGIIAQTTFSGLDNLETYFWHCRAIDNVLNDTSAWSTILSFNFNRTPSAPVNFSPADNDTITSEPFTLIVNNGNDNDNDPLTYHYYLSTNNTFTNIVDSVVDVAEGTTRTTAVFNSFSPANGQTYWWRCRIFDGSTFSNFSTATFFTYVDLSSGNECLTPAESPTLFSPANGTAISVSTPELCVFNSTPNQGCIEPQVYTFEIYSDELLSNLLTTYNDIPEGSGSTCIDLNIMLQSGRFYFWRAKSSNGLSESDWAGPFYFHSPNTPPTTPGLVLPNDGDTVTSLTPTMSITRASDPDGTDITYEFEISIAPDFLSLSSGGQIEDTSSIINWVVSDPLTNLTNYYWRVRTTDGIAYSQYSVTRSFYTESSSQNTPQAPQIHSPADGSTVDSQYPLLTVTNGFDYEGDPLTYDFQVFDQSGVSQIAIGIGITEETTTTGWTVTTPLTNGQSYQWRARCSDGTYYSDWTQLSEFSVDLGVITNNPPTVPNHVSPYNGETITGTPFSLTIENSVDPENDIITYDFFLSDDPNFSRDLASVLDVSETAIETSTEINLVLADGHRYYWRVRANDDVNTTGYSTVTYFDYVDLAAGNDEYTAGIGGPSNGSTILTTTPTLVASNIAVTETKNYYFEVATDSLMYNVVSFSNAVPEDDGNQTTWQVEEELESGEDYFWRVKANDYPFSSVAKIHIQFAAYAAPNPVRLGNEVTFVLPPQKIDLLIQTVSGETVLIQEDVSDEWIWDLNNSDGARVAVGVYLWYIAGSDIYGKVVVKP